MSDRLQDNFAQKYPETAKAARELEGLASRLTVADTGTAAERQTSDKLRDAFLNAGKNPAVQNENKKAIEAVKAESIESYSAAVLISHATSKGMWRQNDGCPDYALLQAKLVYDYFASPTNTSVPFPSCDAGQLTKIEVSPPYTPINDSAHLKTIRVKP